MKNSILLLFLLIPTLLISQIRANSYTLKGGAGVSGKYGENIGLERLLVPHIATTISMNYKRFLGYRWAMEIGLAYERKGFKVDYSSLTFPDMIDPFYGFVKSTNHSPMDYQNAHYDYLTLPISFKWSIDKKKHFYTISGLYTAILLQRKFPNKDDNLYERFNPLDFGVNLGLGYQSLLSKRWFISAEIIGQLGLANTRKYNPNYMVIIEKNLMATLQLGIGYQFGKFVKY